MSPTAAPVGPATEETGPGGAAYLGTDASARGDEDQVGERQTTLERHAGRLMARRLLDGMGMRQHRLRTCGYTLGRSGCSGSALTVGRGRWRSSVATTGAAVLCAVRRSPRCVLLRRVLRPTGG